MVLVGGHQADGAQIRRERFLAEIEKVVPWAGLLGLIELFQPKADGSRNPYLLEIMLRIGYVQEKGLLLRQNTTVDANIIHAPCLTKNEKESAIPRCIRPRKVTNTTPR